MSGASKNKWVLRRDLAGEACLMSRGAATAKAQSPLSSSLGFSTLRSNRSADLRDRDGMYGQRSSHTLGQRHLTI